jgi:hypothetical protein|tara:strand:+ start:2473 stop:2673 length:201 start_codon:yes stop_codon:yes gene_type:complete
MVIYLKHPKHGTKVAICDMEAVADEKNGWTRYTLATLSEEAAPVTNELEVKRRRARPSFEAAEQGA